MFLNQSIPQRELEDLVLAALPAGPATIHDVKDSVRVSAPDVRLYVITGTLLALSGQGRVHITGTGPSTRYERA